MLLCVKKRNLKLHLGLYNAPELECNVDHRGYAALAPIPKNASSSTRKLLNNALVESPGVVVCQ